MLLPTFDRWRAKLISTIDPKHVGTFAALRVSAVASDVALVCPFLRFDGEPCEQLITYYAKSAVSAAGACHRHLGHAFDVLAGAGEAASDPCDADALDASEAGAPLDAPPAADDRALALRLIESGLCAAVDFGTTSINEGFAVVRGADIVVRSSAATLAQFAIVLAQLAEFDIDAAREDSGAVHLTTRARHSEEWICANRVLRELLRDASDACVDATGYRYREIADELPPPAGFDPRTYGAEPSGHVRIAVRVAVTPAERRLMSGSPDGDHATVQLYVGEVPRPGDYLQLPFGRYRFVALRRTGNGFSATSVLERIHEPSRN